MACDSKMCIMPAATLVGTATPSALGKKGGERGRRAGDPVHIKQMYPTHACHAAFKSSKMYLGSTFPLLQSQPLIIETPSQKEAAARLRQRLSEIEEALSLFSRRTVLVED